MEKTMLPISPGLGKEPLAIGRNLVKLFVCCFCLFSAVATTVQPAMAKTEGSKKPIYITFDVPGAGTGANQGTVANAINSTGEISGGVTDGNNAYHSFVRAANGTITSFDAPDAGTGARQGTSAFGINAAGV